VYKAAVLWYDSYMINETSIAFRDGFETAETLYLSDLAAAKAEIERLQKANVFLKEELKQKAKFNPDWDVLQATRESLREAWAENAELREEEAVRLARSIEGTGCRGW